MSKTLRNALSILRLIAERSDAPSGLGEIAKTLEMNPSSCVYLLNTLVEAGYVERLDSRKGYALGPMVHYLAAHGSYRGDVVRVAEPLMAELAAAVEVVVVLATLRRDKRVILSMSDGNPEVRMRRQVLFRDTVLDTATGRLLVAFLSPEKRRDLFPELTDEDEVWISETRSESLARHTSDDSLFIQVAVPIRAGDEIVALGCSLVKGDNFQKRFSSDVERMRRTATAIQKDYVAAYQGNKSEKN